jgi:RsiW-degrading membrane proteinase PrsW (M82 family)
MLWQQMQQFFRSWFIYPNLEWKLILVAIGLALVFGAIWLFSHWPPLFKKPWLWAVAVFSAFFTLLAVVYVQIPLQYYINQGLSKGWPQATLADWLLLAGLPGILLSGLVQEGAKMVPMVAWWWRSGNTINPKLGLAIGALAGAGFGVFEATWALNQVFMAGWTWRELDALGLLALLPFWDRFWVIALHIGASALAGYGLAKGKGWQFYLIASGWHGLINYVVLPYRKGYFTINQVEIWVAVVAALAMAWALWLRWRKEKEEEEPVQTVETVEAGS